MNPETKNKTNSKLFERFMLVFATVEPLATVPQIIQIWSGNSTAGVSLSTWFFYTITSTIWLVYGFKINDKPIIVSGVLWVFSQGLVVVGILLNH
jgi:uncharacterized protein with PQ loop repeat